MMHITVVCVLSFHRQLLDPPYGCPLKQPRAFTAPHYAAGSQGSCQQCCEGHNSLGGASKDNGWAKHEEHVQEPCWYKVPAGMQEHTHFCVKTQARHAIVTGSFQVLRAIQLPCECALGFGRMCGGAATCMCGMHVCKG
jgi:hypothetical protein